MGTASQKPQYVVIFLCNDTIYSADRDCYHGGRDLKRTYGLALSCREQWIVRFREKQTFSIRASKIYSRTPGLAPETAVGLINC